MSEGRSGSFTCPACGMTSHSLNDVREGYCGNCHAWTGEDLFPAAKAKFDELMVALYPDPAERAARLAELEADDA